jgi:hypothetical protein
VELGVLQRADAHLELSGGSGVLVIGTLDGTQADPSEGWNHPPDLRRSESRARDSESASCGAETARCRERARSRAFAYTNEFVVVNRDAGGGGREGGSHPPASARVY